MRASKIQNCHQGASKWPTRSAKGCTHGFLGKDKQCRKNYKANIKSARKQYLSSKHPLLSFSIYYSSCCFLALSVNACKSKAPCIKIIIIHAIFFGTNILWWVQRCFMGVSWIWMYAVPQIKFDLLVYSLKLLFFAKIGSILVHFMCKKSGFMSNCHNPNTKYEKNGKIPS